MRCLCLLCVSVVLLASPIAAQENDAELARACEAGNADACVELADAVDDYGSDSYDRPRALALYERACALDHAKGCYMLGYHTVRREDDRALAAFERGCELGFDSACHSGGEMTRPTGSRADSTRFVSFLERGCDLKWGEMCYNLALLYDAGYWVPADSIRAADLYKRACIFEYQRACETANR